MENDMMTVLLVQPGKHPVEITIPHTLKELQKQVGGTIEIVYPWPDRSVGLVCHDEGKLLGLPLNRALPEIGDAIAGDFLLCGLCDTEDGGSLCSLPPEQMSYMKQHFREPHFFIESAEGNDYFRVTPKVYDNLMGKPKKKPSREHQRTITVRKEKKLNPVKKLAKKTALRTAYQAQAHAKQAGQEIRGGASGEGPSDNYAQQKVEDKAKEAAEDAAGFAFRSTKIPYKMYRRLLLKRQAAKASAGETSSSTPLQNTTVPTETQVTRKTRFRRKAIQQQAIKAKAPQRVQNLMPKENQPLPDRKQVLRKRVILIKAVRKKLAEREARRAATHSMPTPKLPRTSSKPVREQLQRLANYLLGKLKQLLAHAASAVVNALIYLVGAGGVVLILALVIGAAAAILGSPMGILFADESGDPNSIPIGEIVLEANTEFGETISDLVTNHPECSNVEFHYEYEDGHTWSSYWPEVLAVFAVNQNLNGDDDVIVIDREKADLLIDTFWMMHRIESEVEEVVLPADSGDGSEESEDTETQTEYILHITVTSVPVDDLAHDLSFTDDQMDILHQLLSDEMRPMLVQMCGTGTSTGTVPPVVDGSMIWPLLGHTSLTTHFGEADAFGNPGHRGIDIPAPEGTPILAAHSGTVLICGWNDSFGNQVLIDDGAGLSTRYAHMTATAVSPGAVVTAGQVIGYVGSTGDSTGNHLHFEVSVGGTLADPLEYVLPQ